MRSSKIGKCGFARGFLVKTWKDLCYPIVKLAGKVKDCSLPTSKGLNFIESVSMDKILKMYL